MIEIIGSENTNEYAAAVAIGNGLAKLWPGVRDTPPEEDNILIVAGVKLSGYKISDIDVVVAATFGRKRYFVPTKSLKDAEGKAVTGTKILVENFVIAVEEKGHDHGGISISGGEVHARYPDGKKKNATQQNIDQVHSLGLYFSHQHVDAWVYRCLFLQGLSELPMEGGQRMPESGAVALGASGADFLTAALGVNNLRKRGGDFVMSSLKSSQESRAMGASIFKEILPSRLDRLRMDRISAQPAEAKRLAALLGKQRVHIRGHGGTGKTVLMLQAAHEAFHGHGKRCLILTYNVALAADIRRLLALLNIPGRNEGGGVEVRTALSFIYSWLNRLGVSSPDDVDTDSNYTPRCDEALAALKAGALGPGDIQKIIEAEGELFDFDAIVIDEAQDWPQIEADLLASLYGGSKIALADGLDQLVRGAPTNWKRTLTAGSSTEEKSLVECLRMKRNLGIFLNSLAVQAGLNWAVEPNARAAGGRVILLAGSYADCLPLQEEVMREAKTAQNEKIDLLHCVPASDVLKDGDRRHSKLGNSFAASGYEIWDGVDGFIRREFPRSVDALRIVQYESCRGLEGWSTILEGFDEFWNGKYETKLRELSGNDRYEAKSPEASAISAAWRAAMIPLTRPIDTIVITLRDKNSAASRLLVEVANKHPDFISVWAS